MTAYYNWKKQQFYSHIIINENGDPQETQCSRYVKHAEKSLAKRKLHEGYESDDTSIQKRN